MLDLFGILFSSVMMVLVVLRAIELDRTQPWFKPPKSGADNSGLKLPSPRQTTRRTKVTGSGH